MADNPLLCEAEDLQTLAPVVNAPIRHHVFVCTGKSCSVADSEAVKSQFERDLIERGLLFGKAKKGKNPKGSIIVTECGSVGFCAIGARLWSIRMVFGTSRLKRVTLARLLKNIY